MRQAARVVSPEEARSLALVLSGAIEQDHHGFPSFRVAGRIFATMRDPGHLNVMLDEGGIHEAVAEYPEACEELYWGRRLAAVRVTLADIDPDDLAELLRRAADGKRPPGH